MKPETVRWIEKAEEDYRAAVRLLRVRSNPTYNMVCYASQQCAEKYLKAALVENGVPIDQKHGTRIHDLSSLLTILTKYAPAWELARSYAEALSDYGVRFRYPGRDANRTIAARAVKACDLIRDHAAIFFNLNTKRAARVKPQRARRASRYRSKKS